MSKFVYQSQSYFINPKEFDFGKIDWFNNTLHSIGKDWNVL